MDLDVEEVEATRNIGKTADKTENEIEKIIQFMIEDNYNISFISSIRSLMALYKTYLSLYNKEKEKNKELLENATVTYFNDEELKESVGNYLEVLLKKNIEKDYISKDKIGEKIKWLDKRVIENSEIDYFAYLTVGEALSFKHFLEKELLEEE